MHKGHSLSLSPPFLLLVLQGPRLGLGLYHVFGYTKKVTSVMNALLQKKAEWAELFVQSG